MSFVERTTAQGYRLLGSKMGDGNTCIFQGHIDALRIIVIRLYGLELQPRYKVTWLLTM